MQGERVQDLGGKRGGFVGKLKMTWLIAYIIGRT